MSGSLAASLNAPYASPNGILVPVLAVDPPTPTEGQMYFNSTSYLLKQWNGSEWIALNGTQPVLYQPYSCLVQQAISSDGVTTQPLVIDGSGRAIVDTNGVVQSLSVTGKGVVTGTFPGQPIGQHTLTAGIGEALAYLLNSSYSNPGVNCTGRLEIAAGLYVISAPIIIPSNSVGLTIAGQGTGGIYPIGGVTISTGATVISPAPGFTGTTMMALGTSFSNYGGSSGIAQGWWFGSTLSDIYFDNSTNVTLGTLQTAFTGKAMVDMCANGSVGGDAPTQATFQHLRFQGAAANGMSVCTNLQDGAVFLNCQTQQGFWLHDSSTGNQTGSSQWIGGVLGGLVMNMQGCHILSTNFFGPIICGDYVSGVAGTYSGPNAGVYSGGNRRQYIQMEGSFFNASADSLCALITNSQGTQTLSIDMVGCSIPQPQSGTNNFLFDDSGGKMHVTMINCNIHAWGAGTAIAPVKDFSSSPTLGASTSSSINWQDLVTDSTNGGGYMEFGGNLWNLSTVGRWATNQWGT